MTLQMQKESAVRAWIAKKKIRLDCVACGHQGWEVGDVIAPPAAPQGGGTVLGGPSFGLVQIFCQNCGYVMHFNASLIDFNDSLPEDTAETDQATTANVYRG